MALLILEKILSNKAVNKNIRGKNATNITLSDCYWLQERESRSQKN